MLTRIKNIFRIVFLGIAVLAVGWLAKASNASANLVNSGSNAPQRGAGPSLASQGGGLISVAQAHLGEVADPSCWSGPGPGPGPGDGNGGGDGGGCGNGCGDGSAC